MKKSLFAAAGIISYASCEGRDEPLPDPLRPDPELDQTIAFFGDSLTAGTGGTPYGNMVARAFINRPISINAIGGQNSAQICARQGGIPISLNLEANGFNGVNPVRILSISPEFLSTPASTRKFTSNGTVAGIKCTITRTVDSGTTRTKIYTITPVDATHQQIPSGSRFIPDDAVKLKNATQVLWIGRNNTGSTFVDDTLTDIDACVNHLGDQKRFLVLGVLTGANEIKGTSANSVITRLNKEIQTKYSFHYIDMLPPSAEELKAIGYVASAKDSSDIANRTFPQGLRSDSLHLNEKGYEIIAN